jgi:small subunit ribosomal protein S18
MALRKINPALKKQLSAGIDFKNVKLLKQFVDRFGRIKPRYYTGTSLKYQKGLASAIKKARQMNLMPYVRKHQIAR